MAVCTFDGATVPVREITSFDILGDTSGSVKLECTLNCRTTTFSHYTTLAAKCGPLSKTLLLSGKTRVISPLGTSGTLVLNGVTYLTCYIENISAASLDGARLGGWTFNISFVRNTA